MKNSFFKTIISSYLYPSILAKINIKMLRYAGDYFNIINKNIIFQITKRIVAIKKASVIFDLLEIKKASKIVKINLATKKERKNKTIKEKA